RSWEGYETGEAGNRRNLGGAVWKISVVIISLFILAAMTFGIAGPLLNRSDSPRQSQPERTAANVERVIDGRTIVVSIGGGEQVVRMIGVEALPFGDLFYEFAREVAQSWIGGKEVLLESDQRDVDEQGRWLRYVYFDGIMINAALILNGVGSAETEQPNVLYDDFLTDMERQAREANTGIWDPRYSDQESGDSGGSEASLRSHAGPGPVGG
ncbi:MAG: thermonuclease family protein, partial [Dehalococcoidia bacterium]|nr:thermonuclease family protein [Dehalococcoidia bacterium]